MLRNHITTPFFVRQDLQDTTGLTEAAGISLDSWETLTEAGLRTLPTAPNSSLETMSFTPGVYGPNCAQHVALETNDWWRVATVESEEGTAYTFQAAVFEWSTAGALTVVDSASAGDGPGPRSDCADADGER